MKKELFEVIEGNLNKRVDLCSKVLDHVLSTEDLLNLKVSELQWTINMSKSLLSDMDKIYIELHHIFGMGNLTVCQRSSLCSLMDKFSTYRSDLKAIASIVEVMNIPNLPTNSSYTLSVLGDFKLTSNVRSRDDLKLKDEPLDMPQWVVTKDYVDCKLSSSYKISIDEKEHIHVKVGKQHADMLAFEQFMVKISNIKAFKKGTFEKNVLMGKPMWGHIFIEEADCYHAVIKKRSEVGYVQLQKYI